MAFRKWMVGLILAGVLLCGIGTGIGFAEYSTMEYEGHVNLAGEQKETKHLVWKLENTSYDELHAYIYRGYDSYEITEDNKVPRDEVWFDVTYAKKLGDCRLGHTDVSEEPLEDGKTRTVASVGIYRNGDMETDEVMKLMMECKDRLLSELKEHKFSTYNFDDSWEVLVRIHPSNADRIKIMW